MSEREQLAALEHEQWASEILSMGMGYLTSTKGINRMYEEDPEYLSFIIAILSGRAKGITPGSAHPWTKSETIEFNKLSLNQLKSIVTKLAEDGLLKTESSVGRPGLVKKKITVHRGNKVFQQERWVKADKDEKKVPKVEAKKSPQKILMIDDNVKSIIDAMQAGLPESTHGFGIGLVEFNSGEKGIYKTTGETSDIVGETGYSDLAETIGWDVVPQTEEVDFGSGEGTCQRFITGKHPRWAGSDYGPLITESHFDSLAEIFVMDLIVGNVDRHNENIIIDKDNKVWAIDNDTWVGSEHDYNSNDVNRELIALTRRAEGKETVDGERGFSKLCMTLDGSIEQEGFKKFKSIVLTKLEEVLQHTQTIKLYYPIARQDRRDGLEYNIEVAKKYLEANK